ncbi:MAG: alpha/beta hydrolase [Pararhodobacter sp.]|nr:alpha/beta hydrolase [Pararhodobacter sp.]
MTVQTGDQLEKLYLCYTKAQLDAQYDQQTLVPDAAAYMRRWRARSDAFIASHPPRTLKYGAGAQESLDLYGATPGAPLHMHVHGGAWRALGRQDAGFAARGLGAGGSAVAVLDFDLTPAVPLARMVAQVRMAFLWLRAQAGQLTGSAAPVSVSGHSSGAHLAACLLDRAWWADAGLTAADFGPVLLASGCYDLHPVRLSARNTYLHLTPEEAHRLSPLHHLPADLPPLALFWGAGELAEFRRQSTALAGALLQQGAAHQATELPALNHFEIYDCFHDPASAICRAAQAMPSGQTHAPQTARRQSSKERLS